MTKKASLSRARSYLSTEARPLEWALFRYHLEDGPEHAVIEELGRFQNADGGFGRALEPDVRMPGSSALATAIALRHLVGLDGPGKEDLVPAGIDYLLGSLDQTAMTWRVVPPAANDDAHAPWWHDEDGSLARRFGDFCIIPRALIAGVFHRLDTRVPTDMLQRLTAAVIGAVEDLDVLGTGGGSDLEYVAFLAQSPGLSRTSRAVLAERVEAAVRQRVVRDPTAWSEYCLTPLRAVPAPTSLGVDIIRDALEAHLDWTVDHQAVDGAWEPTWSWGDDYPDVWPVAEREWRGILTLSALRSLRAFGRL
ncbi:MAG: hypothetical protein ABFS86_17685 [Planctomycetota bacterium]